MIVFESVYLSKPLVQIKFKLQPLLLQRFWIFFRGCVKIKTVPAVVTLHKSERLVVRHRVVYTCRDE